MRKLRIFAVHIFHTTNAPLYVIVINWLTEAFFYPVILCLGLFFSFVAHMSRCVYPQPCEYCLTGRVTDIQESQGCHRVRQLTDMQGIQGSFTGPDN